MDTSPQPTGHGRSKKQKFVLFFVGLAGFAALLVLGTNAALKLVPPEEHSREPKTLPPIDATVRIEAPDNSSSVRTNIIESPVDSRPINYTATGFTPAELTVRASDPIGCIITVTNQTAQQIRVAVSPHAASGDPGVNYGELAPGETGIYDVLYPGLTEISLHNHLRPEQEMKIIYGEGCR
ncbi:MAG: hypothetical protein AAB591_00010 [Patescibacteria group bacterium]